MSKGLEALEQLSKLVFVYGGVEQYRQIEKELNESKQLIEDYSREIARLTNFNDERDKKAKALEIIKEKDVDVVALRLSKNLEQYNCKEDGRNCLIQKEYDLLKEVLL